MRLLSIIIPAIFAITASASTLCGVRDAVRGEYLAMIQTGKAEEYAAAINAEGNWADIDYADKSTSLWQLEYHLDRLVDMALAYENGGKTDIHLKDAISRGIHRWISGGYSNPNWWYTKIGVPRRMLALAYILDDDLTDTQRNFINESLDAIDSDDFPARPGGDRIQVLSNHAKVLLWRRDYAGVESILRKIEAEARIAPNEDVMYDAGGNLGVRNDWRPSGRGVQSDMSFHHRGDRVDSTVTYGMELPEYFTYWASLLNGSDLEFNEGSIRFIIDYYLDGVCRHLVAGRFIEPSIMNRELSRPGAGVMSPDIAEKLLTLAGGYRDNELHQVIAAMKGESDYEPEFAADFFESAYFVFARPKFHTAVRYHSIRNANQEQPHNNEGIRNHFRGDGACMLSVTGKEYSGIWPVFDFRMVPGATTPLLPYEPLSGWGDVQILNPPTRHAAAVADSLYGAVAFDFISPRIDIQAKKGYFFFDEGYLCLGAGISSTASYEIVTTIEQCISPSSEFKEEGNCIYHNGNIYLILDGEVNPSIQRREGTWSNCVSGVDYADREAAENIFSLHISHGSKPQGASYAYAVIPGMPYEETYQPLPFLILSNTKEIQGASSRDGSLVYMIFYEPGEIDTPAGKIIADEPCIMMIRNGITRKTKI